jgi:hypothetical protein
MERITVSVGKMLEGFEVDIIVDTHSAQAVSTRSFSVFCGCLSLSGT